jgi:drug/metabolite transporter (DMT)-like permease
MTVSDVVSCLALGSRVGIAYATASTHGLLSVVAVLSSLYPLVTIALARVFLKERVVPRQRIGIALCLGGVILIAAA